MADQNLKIQITAIDKTARAFRKIRAGIGGIAKRLASIRVAIIGLAASAGLIKFAGQIDNLAKQSRLLGLTINELQRLQFAASQTGVSSEQLNKGLERFSKNISEAKDGIGVGLRSFEALGIEVQRADGSLRPTTELLDETADRLKDIEDPAQRVRIALDLFGRSGAGLVNTLMEGSGGVKALGDEFDKVTLKLTGKQAEAVEKANDLFDKLGRTLVSIGQAITAAILPPLARLSNFIVVTALRAVSFLTEAFENFLNAVIDANNAMADFIPILIKMDRVDFGGTSQEIADLAAALENTGENSKITADGTNKFLIQNNQIPPSVQESTKAIKDQTKALKETQETMEDVADRGLGRLGDAIANIITGTASAKDAFRSLANSVINDLARMYSQKFISQPLMAAFSSAFAPTPAFSGNPHRAMGGHVTAGQPYIVGERGAEMFIPSSNGNILPNNQMGGGGVVVNQTINLSAGVSQTVKAEVLNMMPQIANAAKGAVLDAKRRGGSFGAAF